MNRTELRETVFRVLFRYEFCEPESFTRQMEMFFSEYPENSDEDGEKWPALKEKDIPVITETVLNILSHISEIDGKIKEKCEGWTFDRIGKAELSIMRIAVYELLYEDEIDTAVSISEAVKLSKIYCDEKTHSFVNGVLAKITK